MNKKLRAARRRKGWTLEIASSKIGVHPNTLRAWEMEIHKPGVHFLVELQRLYDATLYELGLDYLIDSGVVSAQMPEAIAPEVYEPFVGDILMAKDLEIRLLVQVCGWNRPNTDSRDIQRNIQQEIRSYDAMTDHTTNKLANPERRRALSVLATLPIQVYGLTALAPSMVAAEELLPRCVAGITACWQLSDGTDLHLAKAALTAYVPTLQRTVRQAGKHQKVAAGLVAQAYRLQSMLGWHLESLERAEWYANQCIIFSDIAEDAGLQAMSRRLLAEVYYYSNKPKKALDICQEATLYLNHTPIGIHCCVYRGLSSYQAMLGQRQEALVSLKRAHNSFVRSSPEDTPIYAARNEFDLILWDGLTHYHLGYYKEAADSFMQIDGLHPKKPIAERVRIEFLNNQALIEAQSKERDMERAIAYWKAGIQGAVALKSERRYNEACGVYQSMRSAWPEEKRIEDLVIYTQRWDD